MRVFVNEVEKDYPEGTTLLAAAAEIGAEGPRIVLARVNGKLRELYHTFEEGDVISFLTTEDTIGAQTVRRSLSMLLFAAVRRVLPGICMGDVVLHFSIGRGLFYTLGQETNVTLTEKIEKEMKAMVDADLPIYKRSVSTEAARALFAAAGMPDKDKLFSTRLSSRVNIYSLDGYEDYYYGYMAPSTGYLKDFQVLPYHKGLLLVMSRQEGGHGLYAATEHEKLFAAQIEGEKWAEDIGIDHVAELNERVVAGDTRRVILLSEALQEKRIAEIAGMASDREKVKFVMIAGPSSSGKTTFSQRLMVQLEALGRHPHYLGVDNYFINRDEVPLDAYGEKDYESLACVDVALFNHDMRALLAGETVQMPTYDFISGKRVYKGNTLTLREGDLLVVEGIHCLNDQFSSELPTESKFKIYISALAQLNIDGHNRIPTTDGRLIRRIVRDHRTRGYSAAETLRMWASVRRGEEAYIFPYQESADVFYNSALLYELAVLKIYAEPLLFQVKRDHPMYDEARRLLKFLDYFVGIPVDDVPTNSILREFVGGGCFHL